MNHSDNYTDQDPDYAAAGPSTSYQQRIFQENAREQTSRKIAAIIDREFSREIAAKEKEIFQIQEKLDKALKTLHFMRYVTITDFYNRKQCLASQNDVKQTRIHPAVQSSTGKSPKCQNYDNLHEKKATFESTRLKLSTEFQQHLNQIDNPLKKSTTTESKMNNHFQNFPSTSGLGAIERVQNSQSFLHDNSNFKNFINKNNDQNSEESSIFGKKSSENSNNSNRRTEITEPPRKIPRYIPPKLPEISSKLPSRGIRHKTRRRIIVGNISKWIPPDWREDAASHKWTMYVRTSNEESDISEFVSKVRFFLHPSYRPNDVVDVTSPPFHLSRRGWGEFPLRVQLHFINSNNKPMDIIHHLKLDRTYTGLQTLGSETIVDIWINSLKKLENYRNNRDFEKTVKTTDFQDNHEISEKNDIFHGSKQIDNIASLPTDLNITQKRQKIYDTSENSTDFQVKKEIINNDDINIYSHVHFEHDYVKFEFSTLKSQRINQNPENRPHFTIGHSTGQDNKLVVYSPQKSENLLENGFADNCRRQICGSLLEKHSEMSKNSSSVLQPLNITIPPPFSSEKTRGNSQQKHVIVLKDNDKKIMKLDLNSGQKIVSLLKKPNNLVNLKLDPSKSLLLNSNSKIPVLKIVEPIETLDNSSGIFDNSHSNEGAKLTENQTKTQRISEEIQRILVNSPISSKDSSNSAHNIMEKHTTLENSLKFSDNAVQNKKFSDKFTKTKVTIGKDKTKLNSKREFYQGILKTLEEIQIPGPFEATLRFIIKRIPISSPYFADPEYKRLHPYVCGSDEEFFGFNLGKKRALEWYRAKEVNNLLKRRGICQENLWSIKEIMIWCRIHGFTPVKSESQDFSPRKSEKRQENEEKFDENSQTFDIKPTQLNNDKECSDEFNTCTESLEFIQWGQKCKEAGSVDSYGNEEVIDVVQVESPGIIGTNQVNEARSDLITLEVPKTILPMYSYVCNSARQIGVRLEAEEVVEGVVHAAAGRVLVKAVECLFEDLLRSSLAQCYQRNGGASSRCPDEIILDDVKKALINRKEFDIFTNYGLGTQNDD